MLYNGSPICILAGGGHSRAIHDVIRSGWPLATVRVVADTRKMTTDDWKAFEAKWSDAVVGIGQIKTFWPRIELVAWLSKLGIRTPAIIAKDAYVSSLAGIGDGTVIMHRAVVNTSAVVGSFCIINTGAVIEHDAIVGNHSHISTGAIVNGAATVGDRCFIGSNSVILQSCTVSDDTVIGAGSVVTSNINGPGEIWVGNPAKFLKKNDEYIRHS